MGRLLLGTLLLLATTGCPFTKATIGPPRGEGESHLTGGKRRAIALVVPFADQRPSPGRCGMKKDSYNRDTADVLCSESPARFVAALLEQELRAAGFEVVPAVPTGGAAKLEGRLLQFFIEPKLGFLALSMTLEADVHVRLVASAASGLLAERDFYVKQASWAAVQTDETLQAVSDQAVRAIVRDMVAAVIALLDRYPDAAPASSGVPPS